MNSTPADKFGLIYLQTDESDGIDQIETVSTVSLTSKKISQLEYIFEMLRELRKIAKETEEESLVYYLEMAALESGDLCDVQKFRQETILVD